MNSVQLIGNISTDIDLKATSTGKFVAKFNLAIANPYNREKTVFLPIEIWGKNAENTSNYCQKGSKVGVVGHIDVEQWEKDGQKRSRTKIVANSIEFLTPKSNQSSNQQQSQTNNHHTPNKNITDDPFQGGQPIDINSDDLPF